MDPAALRLVFRAFAQFQLSRPREIDHSKSLRFFFVGVCLINFGPLARHLLGSWSYETDGILLDFVGRGAYGRPPVSFHAANLTPLQPLHQDRCILYSWTLAFLFCNWSHS